MPQINSEESQQCQQRLGQCLLPINVYPPWFTVLKIFTNLGLHKICLFSLCRFRFDIIVYPKKTANVSRRHRTGFPAKDVCERLQKSIIMTCNLPKLGSACDWLKQIFLAARTIRSTAQILISLEISSTKNTIITSLKK